MIHRQVEENGGAGRSKSGNTAALRCHKCGALSQVPVGDVEADRGPSVGAEFDAILVISQALTQLQDDERQRVLHWAAERFSLRASADLVAPALTAPDVALRVEDLDDLFGSPSPDDQHANAPAEDDELGDLFEETAIAPESLVEAGAAAETDQHNPPLQIAEAPLDALVADFVSEFRRLAVKCQGS
jgi:hypothetical protein